MNGPLDGMHPSFDDLSAHVDRSDVDAARSRVGRHVAKCAACRGTVGEIRAMGDAARAVVLSGAPAGLWERIAESVASGARRASADVVRSDGAVALPLSRDDVAVPAQSSGRPPATKRVWETRLGLGLVAALLVSSAVFVVDSWRPLSAATPSRLTLSREYVVPGTALTVHYRPIAALAGAPSVTVWARYSDTGSTSMSAEPGARYGVNGTLVRAGTLRRISAQDYAGSLLLPVGVHVARYLVGDSLGNVLDRAEAPKPAFLGTVIAAGRDGRPLFGALVALFGDSRAVDRTTLERAAQAMNRFYPSRPETWILTYPIAHRGVIRDIVKRFESRERVYYGWYDKLAGRPVVSAETEVLMAQLGNELMDTARADFWIDRLVTEHPTNAALPGLWIRRYRDVPTDSIVTVLGAFEPIYRAPAVRDRDAARRASVLADSSGDPELASHWRSYWVDGTTADWQHDPAALAAHEATLREQLVAAERDSLGAPTFNGNARIAAYMNWHYRLRLRTELAAVRLVRGDAAGAKTALDEIAADAERRVHCPLQETLRWRADAERRLGQSKAARDDYAYAATNGPWQTTSIVDSIGRTPGVSSSTAEWEQARRAAAARQAVCFEANRNLRKREGW